MRRGIVFGVPGVVAATGAGLWVETHRLARAPLPQFEDLDPSGTYGDPSGPPLRITVLGDSSVTGPGLRCGSDSWIAQLADRLPVRCEVTSLAKGGSRVGHVLDDQCPVALESGSDLFVVAVGANDVMHATPVPLFRRRLIEVLQGLTDVAPVVAMGIGDLSVIPRLSASLRPVVRWRSSRLDQAHRRVAAAVPRVVRVPVHDVADPLFAHPEVDLFAADRFHPNALGHALWAQSFEPSFRSLVSSMLGTAERLTDTVSVGSPLARPDAVALRSQ